MITSAKGIVLILFLYLALVWTGVTYQYTSGVAEAGRTAEPGRSLLTDGLRYSTYGIGALLALVVGSWGWGQWKSLRSRAAARPKPERAPAAKPQPKLAEDVAALQALLEEAAKRLSASATFSPQSNEGPTFSGMPLYLIVGTEGAGKTSIVVNSGLEAELLAGQPGLEKSSPSSTTIANIWLAGEALLIELGGRHFSGDGARWEDLLRVLAAKPRIPFWRRLWKGDRPGFDVRGIVHCSDLRFFLTKPGPEQIERQSQLVQQRLRSAVKVLGKPLPVYNIFSKADLIPYFREFFGRFSEQEAEQVLGCTLRFDGVVAGEADTGGTNKRLSKAFQNLYTALTERRLSILFHEPMAGRKSKIYEFPREFNRLRQSIADFLSQTFRSSPLEATPINRGFYFCGTREVESLAPPPDSRIGGLDVALDATIIFRGNAADAPRPDADLNLTRVRRGGLQTRWAFLSSLFQDVIAADRLVDSFVPAAAERPTANPHKVALVTVLSISIALGLLWAISWIQNASWVRTAQAASADAPKTPSQDLPTTGELESLENLRVALVGLNERGQSWNFAMRMGLYSIPDLRNTVREAYFRRFKSAVLDREISQLAGFFKSLGEQGNPDQPPNKVVSDRFKAYMMVVQPGTCDLDSDLVSRELKAMTVTSGINPSDSRYALAARQIDFYAGELTTGTPIQYGVDNVAKARAAAYLGAFRSIGQYYRGLIDSVEQDLPTADLSSVTEYTRVLASPKSSVSAAFTPQGQEKFRDKLDSGVGQPTDACLSGVVDPAAVASLKDEDKNQIENLYSRDYLEAWRSFLSEFRVLPFSDASDAAQRLETLAGNNSPLLGLLTFVARNTNFSSQQTAPRSDTLSTTFKEWVPGLQKALAPPADVNFTLSAVEDAFQPVHAITSVDSRSWITPENEPYVKALGELSSAVGAIARAPRGSANDAMYDKARAASQGARDATRGLKLKFNSFPVGRVDEAVVTLLEGPIKALDSTGILNEKPVNITANERLRRLCENLVPVLRKYPIRLTSEEISLKEFETWFAPEAGRLWAEQKAAFGAFTIRTNGVWQTQPGADLEASADFLNFLNAAQTITNAFFNDGKTLGFYYGLRPIFANPAQVIELRLDGESTEFTTPIQRDFSWPSKLQSGQTAVALAGGRTNGTVNKLAFASGQGPWAVFRLLREAERTQPRRVQWKRNSSGTPLEPSVTLEFSELPGNQDVFDPSFFAGVRSCPQSAVRPAL